MSKAVLKHKTRTLKTGDELFRISSEAYKNQIFNPYGPQHRFDHHPTGKPRVHAAFGTCYCAKTFKAAVGETFLDAPVDVLAIQHIEAQVKIGDKSVVKIEVLAPLKLLSLLGDAPLRLGLKVGVSYSKIPREVTQEFARQFYNDVKTYSEIDGIIWPSSKCGLEVIVLNERAKSKVKITQIAPLRSGNILDELLQIFEEYKILVEDL